MLDTTWTRLVLERSELRSTRVAAREWRVTRTQCRKSFNNILNFFHLPHRLTEARFLEAGGNREEHVSLLGATRDRIFLTVHDTYQ